MGCICFWNQSAQIADLIDIYIIDTLGSIIDKEQVGIYKDDGLIHIPNSNGPKSSQLQKQITNKFKEIGFRIEIQANLRITNYLDITLNLNDNTYKPFSKDSQPPTYININSNHTQSIIKHLPNAINTRLNKLSANRKIFRENSATYNQALEKSGYKTKLKYIEKQPTDTINENPSTDINEHENNKTTHRKTNRKRRITWFNPPFCKLTNINIGKEFIKLVRKHFHHDNPLHKILNKNTLKISYSCTSNIQQTIQNHNKRTLKQSLTPTPNNHTEKLCNCKDKNLCPVKGICCSDKVVYQAKIFPAENTKEEKIYFGISAGSWKQRYYGHKYSFSNATQKKQKKKQTALSKHYWYLKDKGYTPTIEWSFIKKSTTPIDFRSRCNLCLEEKISIIKHKDTKNILNRRNELVHMCRHRGKLKLTSQ